MLRFRNAIRKVLWVGGAVTGAVLTGCGSGAQEVSQSVAMVMGVHRNFPEISLNVDSVYSKIYEACYTFGNVLAVIVDGDPFAVCNYNISAPKKRIDSAKRRQLASNNSAQIMKEISDARAQTPEIDTLSAIFKSADALHSVPEESEKSMIVFDSGLSTASPLNFAERNLMDTPVDYIVEQLEEIHAVPDLTDIDILWVGLGETCGEQGKLTPDYKYKLRSIWEGILEAGGASSVTFDKSLLSTEEALELPECSIVPVIASPIPDKEQDMTKEKIPEAIKWDGNSAVQFKADEAEFIDKAAAVEEFKPIAEYLKANPKESIYIFGMTATVTEGDTGIELSEARANACKGILEEMGVQESRMTTVGLGQMDHPLRVVDIDANGEQIEELAQKNRAVFVVKDGAKQAEILLGSLSCSEKV
ncbi:OmpA family protein [Lachnospiraceae bacterium 46-15]